MNKLAPSIHNRIKQPSQCCIYCGKSYIKRANLGKHIVICELLQQRSRPNVNEEDFDEPIPSQMKLFHMLIELGQKYKKLEEKMEDMNKWVIKKKKKINVLEWLNANIHPTIHFDVCIDKITIIEEDIKNIMENTFYDALRVVFERSIYNFSETENPIFGFLQKPNVFYVYNQQNIWVELEKDQLIKFLKKVHMKIFTAFYDWKKTKMNEIKSDEGFAISCNKTIIKLTSIMFNQESVLNKIRNSMFAQMKTDMKSLIEYEFEF